MSILQDYLVIPAEHLFEIMKAWEERHFGHIIHDESKALTAEYARTNLALADIKAALSGHIVQQPVSIVPDETPDSTAFVEVDPTEILQHAASVQTIVIPTEAPVESVIGALPTETPAESIVVPSLEEISQGLEAVEVPEVKTEAVAPVNVENTELLTEPASPEATPQ